ncbi:hypothetical protein HK100_012081 [Physocladia obscura]|uniref:Uncharacterized protein n=1 Tax=Physocladia obscura TaxID=109957 RepID=A0AAD5XCR8_9FUNG|nr:hypothetical protein HK100_012081 [Physocladia obscura]
MSTNSLKAHELGMSAKEFSRFEAKRIREEEHDRKRVKEALTVGILFSGSTIDVGIKFGSNCLNIYANSLANESISFYSLKNALAQSDFHEPTGVDLINGKFSNPDIQQTAWTNLISENSTSLIKETTKLVVGIREISYQYVIVSWYRPIKVTGKIDVFVKNFQNTSNGVNYILGTRGINIDNFDPNPPDFSQTSSGGLYTSSYYSLLDYEASNGSFELPNSLHPTTPYYTETIIPVTETQSWYSLINPISLSLSNGGFQRRKIALRLVLDDSSVLMQGTLDSTVYDGITSSKNTNGTKIKSTRQPQFQAGNLIDSLGNSLYMPPPSFAPIITGAQISVEKYILSLTSQNIMAQLTLYVTFNNEIDTASGTAIAGASLGIVPGWFNFTTSVKEGRFRENGIILAPKISKVIVSSSEPFSTLKFVDFFGIEIVSGLEQTTLRESGTVFVRCAAFQGWQGSCMSPNSTWTGFEEVNVFYFDSSILN